MKIGWSVFHLFYSWRYFWAPPASSQMLPLQVFSRENCKGISCVIAPNLLLCIIPVPGSPSCPFTGAAGNSLQCRVSLVCISHSSISLFFRFPISNSPECGRWESKNMRSIFRNKDYSSFRTVTLCAVAEKCVAKEVVFCKAYGSSSRSDYSKFGI